MSVRATALVVEAEPPVSGASRWASESRGTVTILVDVGSGTPAYVAKDMRLSEDRWLVPGMEIPVSIDPAKPERFEVEWDTIPSIEERVAANDPTLADPAGARRKVAAALESAGVMGVAQGAALRGMAGGRPAPAAPDGSTPNRLEEAIREAAQKPTPPGKQRAVVVVATATVSGDSSLGFVEDPNTDGPP